eukprot:SAG11_NODE_292_length_11180_cov_6.023825_3_plen_100_part_00
MIRLFVRNGITKFVVVVIRVRAGNGGGGRAALVEFTVPCWPLADALSKPAAPIMIYNADQTEKGISYWHMRKLYESTRGALWAGVVDVGVADLLALVGL